MNTEFCNLDLVISDNGFQTFEELLHEVGELLKLAAAEEQSEILTLWE